MATGPKKPKPGGSGARKPAGAGSKPARGRTAAKSAPKRAVAAKQSAKPAARPKATSAKPAAKAVPTQQSATVDPKPVRARKKRPALGPIRATIAIVGRPNVGKSTLFNRLVGKRLALVDDQPGLTRDRKMAEADLGGIAVRLIDTAGLETAEAGTIADRMRKQSELAIAEADAVLFVLDARAGVTADDRTFADLARAAGKPILLVVNKCEGRAGEAGFYESFGLGFGEPIAISAEHAEGLSDLVAEMRALVAMLDPEPEEGPSAEPTSSDEPDAEPEDDPTRPIKVAIVGRPNAGKSTLVNALLGEERVITGPEAGLTRDTIAVDFTWRGRAFTLHDTAGLRKKARVAGRAEHLAVGDALRAIDFAEVVILLVDAEQPFEKQDLTIADLVTQEGRALVVGVNKWDLVPEPDATLKALRADLEHQLAQAKGLTMVPVSALAGRGLDKLMAAVVGCYQIWNKRVATHKLNQWLQAATEAHSPPAVEGRAIKLRFMTQSNARPPTFVVFCSRPDALPDAYVRYLVNGLREAFGFQGVPIRLHLRKGDNPYASRAKRPPGN